MERKKSDWGKISADIKDKGSQFTEKTKSSIQKSATVVKDSSTVIYKKAVEKIDANGNGEIC